MNDEGNKGKALKLADEMMALQRRSMVQSLWMLVVVAGGVLTMGFLSVRKIPVWLVAPFFVFLFWKGIVEVLRRQRVFSRRACPGCGEMGLRAHPYRVKGSNVAQVECKHCGGIFETDLKGPFVNGGMFYRRWE